MSWNILDPDPDGSLGSSNRFRVPMKIKTPEDYENLFFILFFLCAAQVAYHFSNPNAAGSKDKLNSASGPEAYHSVHRTVRALIQVHLPICLLQTWEMAPHYLTLTLEITWHVHAYSGFRVWACSLDIGDIGSSVPFKILQAYASGNIIRSTEQSCTRGLTPESVVCLSWVSPRDASSHGCGGV